MKNFKLLLSLILMTGLIAFFSCNKDDEEADPLTITSIDATGTDLASGIEVTKDLNAATSATDVPLDAIIKITFSKNVDVATVTSTAVTLLVNSEEVPSTVSTSGSIVTLTPEAVLSRGKTFTLTLASSIKASDEGTFTEATRTFKTAGIAEVIPPQVSYQVAYWDFNGNTDDSENHVVTDATQITGYNTDRHGYSNSAVELSGGGDIVEVTNSGDFISPSTTISLWFKKDLGETHDDNRGFLIGIAAERGFFCEIGGGIDELWIKFATSHELHPDSPNGLYATSWFDAINGQGGEPNDVLLYNWEGDLAGLIDNVWTHMVMTYDNSTTLKTVYINGVKMRQEDLSGNPDWHMIDMAVNSLGVENFIDTDLGIGYGSSTTNTATSWLNYQSDPSASFEGLIDDVRFFSVSLTAEEVLQLYNDEKP